MVLFLATLLALVDLFVYASLKLGCTQIAAARGVHGSARSGWDLAAPAPLPAAMRRRPPPPQLPLPPPQAVSASTSPVRCPSRRLAPPGSAPPWSRRLDPACSAPSAASTAAWRRRAPHLSCEPSSAHVVDAASAAASWPPHGSQLRRHPARPSSGPSRRRLLPWLLTLPGPARPSLRR